MTDDAALHQKELEEQERMMAEDYYDRLVQIGHRCQELSPAVGRDVLYRAAERLLTIALRWDPQFEHHMAEVDERVRQWLREQGMEVTK